MVYNSLKAAELLEKNNIFSSVIDMHTIKPLDVVAIEKELEDSKLMVTVEEHSIIGGLGSAVSEFLSSQINVPPLTIIGI